MPRRIQEHPHIILRLKLSQHRAHGHRKGPGRVKIIDLDIQMHQHLPEHPDQPASTRPHVSQVGLE